MNTTPVKRPLNVFVIGAGSWGTTLALHCHWIGHHVTVWEKFEELIDRIIEDGENRTYLPGVPIPRELRFTSKAKDLSEGFDLVIFAVPSKYIREVSLEMRSCLNGDEVVASATKGLEQGSLLRISQILEQELSEAVSKGIVALSGPSHAEEVSRKLPTTLVSASRDLEAAAFVQKALLSGCLRVYTNNDIIGVELGGALKNIIAIANGICAGLGYGDNTTGALITRGITEISRLGVAMGADPKTFSGLSGIGDLITTCISGHSRNRHVGFELAKGKVLDGIVSDMVMVAEGIETTKAAVELSRRHDIEMPITEQVHGVLFEGKDPKSAVDELMLREPKPEL